MIQRSKMGWPQRMTVRCQTLCFGLSEVEMNKRTGLPERYDSWKTTYSRFCKWRDDGTLLKIFQVLNEDVDMENLSLDSTIIVLVDIPSIR